MFDLIKKNSKIFFLFLAVIITIPGIIGLLHLGFPLTDDGNWMVVRFSAFYEVLRSGEFPVRFLTRLNNGFGYPVSNFLYPLFMYLGVPIHILGISFVDTIKVIFGFSLIFSSAFTYLWLRKIFDNLSSLVGSVFYTFFPYHLFDVYRRGSLGEALALSILPFIFWQIERKSVFFISVGIFLLTLSHNSLALFFIPLILFYGYFRKRVKFVLISLFFGLAMSSFFSIPAVYDLQYTIFNKTKVSDLNLYFVDLLTIQLLGFAFIFLLLESIFHIIKHKNNKFIFSVFSIILITFFTLSISKYFWFTLSFTNLIQFPFRLISLLIPITAFMSAYLLSKEKKSAKLVLVSVYLILIFFSSWKFIVPQNYQYFPDSYYFTNMDTTTVKNEYMPKWVKDKKLEFTLIRVENLTGQETVNVSKVSPKEIVFNTFLTQERVIRVNLVYFPGWNVYVNGVKNKINYQDSGLIQLNLEKGQNNVRVVFEETGIRILSDLLSIISILGLLLFIYLIKIKKIKI